MRRLIAFLRSRTVETSSIAAILAVGGLCFFLPTQSPQVLPFADGATMVTSQTATTMMHVILRDGSFSDRSTVDTTVTTTTKE